jgi:hypothetical protein
MRFDGVIRLLLCVIAGAASSSASNAQTTDSLPFGAGERLTFGIRAWKFGTIGHAVMAVQGTAVVRGVETMVVTMDTKMRVLFMKGSDANRSWIDPRRMTSLRFEKHQRRLFSTTDDSVEIFPDLHRWSGAHGDSGSIADSAPLDELSFLYFLRTVSLAPDSTYAFDRLYDKRRIPSIVRVVKREQLDTPAGIFNTVELEMRVKDGPGWKDEWVVRVWISDDRCRLPVRMESAVPVLGAGVMTLESAVTPTECGRESAGSRTQLGSDKR